MPPATSLSESLAATGTFIIEPRILRRVIRRHRELSGVGLDVRHGKVYTLPRAALLSISGEHELGTLAAALPEHPVLVPRPDERPADGPAGLVPFWRLTFHALVHQAYEAGTALTPPHQGDAAEPPAAGIRLSPAALRERVHHIGQAEFDEIRYVLRQDDFLLPPYDERETWIEFAAVYLELRHFAPAQLKRTFPTLQDLEAVDALLARDLDVSQLLRKSRPPGAPESPLGLAAAVEPEAAAAVVESRPRPRSNPAAAAPARARGNLVRAALLAWRGGDVAAARRDLESLAARVKAALPNNSVPVPEWVAALEPLLAHAAAQRALRRTVEIRLLLDLNKAAFAHEHEVATVDPVGWLLSLGEKPVARSLPAGREVRVARQIHQAKTKLGSLGLPEKQRRPAAELLRRAADDADAQVRAVLRPSLEKILDEVDLRPGNVPEQVARHKLIDELLDQVVAHGYLNLGQLRDAISRNQLKLPSLSGPLELLRGDPLLRADRRLAVALDGVYRRGEIYLRFLQKLSSLFFGTAVGRFLTLYAILPVLLAFVVLEGLQHIVGPFAEHVLHVEEPEIFSWPRFIALSTAFFLLLHVVQVRRVLGGGLRLLGRVLRFMLIGAPRRLWRSGPVQRIAHSRPVGLLVRFVLKPALFAVGFYFISMLFNLSRSFEIAVGVGFFVVWNLVLNSRAGFTVEEIVIDWLVRSTRHIGRRLLPGLFHLIVDFFKVLLDAVERLIYAVDELLRYRRGESRLALWLKGIIGILWRFVTYLLRIYLNLFIEPTVNPIKHFPVVTVAAKIQLPLTPALLHAARTPLVPIFGKVVGNAVAGFTVLVIPGVYGFLAWELKENWRLYAANRPRVLRPVPIGHHGETLIGYLKPGFHSGTIPKTYSKLRRAAWKGSASAAKHREALHHIEERLRVFAERELGELLALAPGWSGGPVEIGRIEIASNRVRLELLRGGEPARLGFEEQSGLILAGVVEPGWIGRLTAEQRSTFESALAGFYKLAAVDMVREQIAAVLTGDSPYDIADEGLVVWPDGKFKSEVIYPISMAKRLEPVMRGEPPPQPPRPVDADSLLFVRQDLPWRDWVAAWADGADRRLVAGASLLPPNAPSDGPRASSTPPSSPRS